MRTYEAEQLRPGERIICQTLRATITDNRMGSIAVRWDNGESRSYKYEECLFFTSLVFKLRRHENKSRTNQVK